MQVQAEGDRLEARTTLSPESPWFEGHFPGNPVFPGLGMLALVEQAARQGFGLSEADWPLAEARRVRFRRAMRPEEELSISLRVHRTERGVQVSFSLGSAGEDVGKGVFAFVHQALTIDQNSG